MMSFAFLRKALGIKKGADEKDFEEFWRSFYSGDNSCSHQLWRIIKKKPFRFVVLRDEDRKILFDSNSSKDSVKALPVGSKHLNLFDIVFGSHVLSTSKELLFSIKVHDLSSCGYLLISRVVTDIDEWNATKLYGRKHCFKRPNGSPSVPQLISRSETHKSVAACLMISVEAHSVPPATPALKGGNPPSNFNCRRNTSVFTTEEGHFGVTSSQRQLAPCIKRFYHMLFEHSAYLSVLIESLVESTLVTVCRPYRGCSGSSASLSEIQSNAIGKIYSQYLPLFRDLFSPKLQFPLWTTFNNILYSASDSITSLIMDNPQLSWSSPLTSNVDFYVNAESMDSSLMASYDSLTNLFLRHCLGPLLSRGGREGRYFLSQIVTGILTLYPGWVSNLANTQFHQNTVTVPNTPLHSSGCSYLPNMLLDQLLTQGGCLNLNLDSLGGAIFNCTVLTGQSQHYLMALLYFTTYFLRCTSLSSSNESVPDLGKVDLFELEHQRRRSRMSSKTRRKSGSAVSIGGDAPDSGISSQEDLTASLHSSSTGSSPTHTSGMALCMPQLLTRYQCRLAEAAAQLTVAREAAAAASAMNTTSTAAAAIQPPSGLTLGGPCVPVTSTARLPAEALVDSSNATTSTAPQSRYTEVPLLIEKFVEEQCDQCACATSELFPGQNSLFGVNTTDPSSPLPTGLPSASPTTAAPRLAFRAVHDSSPAMPTGVFSSQTSSPTSGNSPRLYASSLINTAPSSQVDLARGATQMLGMGRVPATSVLPPSDLAYRSFEQPATRSVTNHSLIGAAVSDRFATGLVLQATFEHPDSFREHLEDQLSRWLRLGPLIVRGMNLSTRKFGHEAHFSGIRVPPGRVHHGRTPQWYACGLLVNVDNKSVELLTLRQTGSKEPITPIDSTPTGARSSQRSSRHSFSQSGNNVWWSSSGAEFTTREVITGPNKQSLPDRPHPTPIRPAPLVTRLLDQTHLVFERTNCAALALRDLESGLQSIYQKSRILADLLTLVGPSLLQQPNRMMIAANCSADDLPLLLSTVAAYSLPGATLLHSHFNEWWFS